MIDTLQLEKQYWELSGYKNVNIVEEDGSVWLESASHAGYGCSLPTICYSQSQALTVMLVHKINVTFYSYGVEAF